MPIQPKKALGQHFLHNSSIAARIVEALEEELPRLQPDTQSGTPALPKAVTNRPWPVLEVGPGTGVLTALLLQNPAIDYYGVELDRRAADYLHKAYPQLKSRLVCDDFLTLSPDAFPGRFALIGNFPYNISSQIFFKVLEMKNRIPLIVGMLQKEVAERFCSPPGSRAYGILSVLLQTWYRAEYLFSVAPGAFTPPPKVQSGVIRLIRNDRTSLDCPEYLYLKIIKTAFNQRRKMLSNSLKPLLAPRLPDVFGHPAAPPQDNIRKGNSSLHSIAIDGLHRRPEQLGVEDFIALTKQIAAL